MKLWVPKAPFDYTDGAAETESSLNNARNEFKSILFHPRVLRDVSGAREGRCRYP